MSVTNIHTRKPVVARKNRLVITVMRFMNPYATDTADGSIGWWAEDESIKCIKQCAVTTMEAFHSCFPTVYDVLDDVLGEADFCDHALLTLDRVIIFNGCGSIEVRGYLPNEEVVYFSEELLDSN